MWMRQFLIGIMGILIVGSAWCLSSEARLVNLTRQLSMMESKLTLAQGRADSRRAPFNVQDRQDIEKMVQEAKDLNNPQAKYRAQYLQRQADEQFNNTPAAPQ
jgi:hypothetical protein